MRLFPPFLKLTGIAVLIALVAFGVLSSPISIRAGVPAQATDEAVATDAPTDAPTDVATEAAAETEAAATADGTVYPPCPSTEPVPTEAPTDVATDTATDSATLEAAIAPTINPNPAYLGVRAAQVQDCGVRIVEIVENGPAAAANLQVDDVIVALNGERVTSLRSVRNEVETRSPGDKITLTVQRRGQQLDIEVTLGSKPTTTPEAVETEMATEVEATEAAPGNAETAEATP